MVDEFNIKTIGQLETVGTAYMFTGGYNCFALTHRRPMVAFWLIFVACLWGVTNPFIKRGSQGIESIQASTPLKQFIAELWFLITNIKYLVPFIINQSGSVVYYLTLSAADLSLAVPITNSLTFLFTGITGHILGEKISSKKTVYGMVLVVAGVTLCVLDKV